MSAARKCRGCGTDVPSNAPFGHCPKCLLELGFGPVPERMDAPPLLLAKGGERPFGDYYLLDQIGRGGMGVIYKARQVTLNRRVAIKLVRPDELPSATLIQRFHLEAEAAASLHHPNIVPIYETGEHEGQHFFSMELIDGKGLDRYITNGGFAFGEEKSPRSRNEQIARIMAKVARAVDYAHQHGVLHRDLKPSNILLDAQCEPHLTDFGVAKVTGRPGSSLTASGAIMGTPSYMAPEQAVGKTKRVTTAADTYSLGAILYEMLIGHPPFRGDTPVETLKQVVEEEPRHPSTLKDSIDRDLATICMKCLEKEPQRRYASAAALAEDLERWLRHEPILARPIGPLGRMGRWCRREPTLAGLAAGIGVCLVAIAVVALAAYRNAEASRQQLQSVTDELIQDQLNQLDNFWTNSTDISITIPSERLARLTSRPPRQAGTRVTFGVYTHTSPSDMLTRFAPFISFLETNTDGPIPLRIDFVIYRHYSDAVQALAEGRLGFMRPGPGAYIRARQRNPGLLVLAKQLHNGQPIIYGVIFTRADSGIVDLKKDIGGKSVASADDDSTFGNYVPKAYFREQGIHMRDLPKWKYVGAHDETVKQVAAGTYDIGAANSNVVARFMSQTNIPLRILHPMQSISFPWVASTNLPTLVVKTIRGTLLSLKDLTILGKMDRDLDGFRGATPADYDSFERNVIEQADAFDL